MRRHRPANIHSAFHSATPPKPEALDRSRHNVAPEHCGAWEPARTRRRLRMPPTARLPGANRSWRAFFGLFQRQRFGPNGEYFWTFGKYQQRIGIGAAAHGQRMEFQVEFYMLADVCGYAAIHAGHERDGDGHVADQRAGQDVGEVRAACGGGALGCIDESVAGKIVAFDVDYLDAKGIDIFGVERGELENHVARGRA